MVLFLRCYSWMLGFRPRELMKEMLDYIELSIRLTSQEHGSPSKHPNLALTARLAVSIHEC